MMSFECGIEKSERRMADRKKRAKIATGMLCTWRSELRARMRRERFLQFKGFVEGVPQNTERTTVNPWVGIAR